MPDKNLLRDAAIGTKFGLRERIQGALLGHFGSVFPAMMTTDQVRQI
ncbi:MULTISPECIES: hypothetical protein [Pseudomonas]|nr:MULTISPECIES: hypothetical protein [Pseudomonas]WEX13730.1 hypothetical protein P2T68_24275 [Pseudomonas sp. G11]